jgi:hypothetical protein
MKNSLKVILAAGFLGTVSMVGITTTAAVAQPVGFSFRIGDVRLAYTDGYYDRYNRWHGWRSARERAWYQSNYQRYRNASWRNMRRADADRDGIPNRFDRDRDNDGVPNRFDDRPNNPYRR